MKKVIFDVDGVLLSEEHYYDASALTICEILYSKDYMGLSAEGVDFISQNITEGMTASCRNKVWGNNRLLAWLKSKGINSNWDMVHIYLITVLWILAGIYRDRSEGDRISLSLGTIEDIKRAGMKLMGLPIPDVDDILNQWKKSIPESVEGAEVINCLVHEMKRDFEDSVEWGEPCSCFWKIHTEAFQNWYLGDDLFISFLHKMPYSGGKEGFLNKESPLVSAEEIRQLFIRLKRAGFELGIATGRSREEMMIPFKNFKWYEEFDPLYMATASDAVEASCMFSCPIPDKPAPFIYSCAIYGRNKDNYSVYLEEKMKPSSEDEIYVCGDSYSDIIGSRKAGTRFIGIFTEINGIKQNISDSGNLSFVNKVTDIEQLLLNERG